MTDTGSQSSGHVTNHPADDIFHWCSSSNPDWDPQIFFCKYSNGILKEPFPDELVCLRHCWDCVHGYHQERQKFVELNQEQTEWVLFSFECNVLRDSLEEVKQELARKKQGGSKGKNANDSPSPSFLDLTIHLPIVLQEILKHPFFFFMKDVHDLFIEVLNEIFTIYGKNQNVPQFPGIYLLLVHPDNQVRNWAEKKVVQFDPIQLADSSDLLQVVNIVFSVLKFGIQNDPSVCDYVTMDEPSRRVIISSYQFNMDVYWQGLHNLLNHMDADLVNNIKEEIPQNILNSVLQAAESEDPKKSFFLLKLSCFVVLLKSSKEAFWLKVQDPQDFVFISIIRCRVWKALLEKISWKCTENPAGLCEHFTWVLPWAKSLNGSQGVRATDIDYTITYIYHVQIYIQHRHYHLHPTSLPYDECQGTQQCKFYEMKRKRGNRPLGSLLPQPTMSQKLVQEVFNDIMRHLFHLRKCLPKQFSSRGMQTEVAGSLSYKGIMRLVTALYQNNSPRAKVLEGDDDESGSESDSDVCLVSNLNEEKTVSSSQSTPGHFPGENKSTPLLLEKPTVMLKRKPVRKLDSPESNEVTTPGPSDSNNEKLKSRFKFKAKLHSKDSGSTSHCKESHEDKEKAVSSEEAKNTLSAPVASMNSVDITSKSSLARQEQHEKEDQMRNIFDVIVKVKNKATSTRPKSEVVNGSKATPVQTVDGASSQLLAQRSCNGPWRKLSLEPTISRSSTTIVLDKDGQPSENKSLPLKLRQCSVRLSRISDRSTRTPKRTLARDSDSDNSDVVSIKKRSKRLSSDEESSCSETVTAMNSGKGDRKCHMQENGESTSSEKVNSKLQYSTQSDSDWEPPDVFKDDAAVESSERTKGSNGIRRGGIRMLGRDRRSDSQGEEDEVILISSSDDEDFVEVRKKRRRVKNKNSMVIVSDNEEGGPDVNEGSVHDTRKGRLGPPIVVRDLEVKQETTVLDVVKKEDKGRMKEGKSIENKKGERARMKPDGDNKRIGNKEVEMELGDDNKTIHCEEGKMKLGDDQDRADFKGIRRKGKCDAENCKACQGLGGKHVTQNTGKDNHEKGRIEEEKDDGKERWSTLVEISPILEEHSDEEHSDRSKNLSDDRSEKEGNMRIDSIYDGFGKTDERDMKNSFLTKYTIFTEEESCMDSDAETDDGSGTEDKEKGLSSLTFDFQEDLIDQMEDEPTLTQLDRLEKEGKTTEEDGDILDGLDLDEIIDITESLTESEMVVDNDEKPIEDEECHSSHVDAWNESSSDAPLVISETPVKVESLTEEEKRDRCDEKEVAIEKHALEVQEKQREEKAESKLKEEAKETVKSDNILLGFLEGGSTEEDEGDEDDGWVDEDSSWEVGDDGWVEGADEDQEEGEEGGEAEEEMEEEEEEEQEQREIVQNESQGFQVSAANPDVMPSLVQRIVTGVKGGVSSKSQETKFKKRQEKIVNLTKRLEVVSEEIKKCTVQKKDGFRSKSFYRHGLANKKIARKKNNPKRTKVNYAAVKQKMLQRQVSDSAVPLGNMSLVTGQVVRGGKAEQELGDPRRSVNEPTTSTAETRLAPPIKSSAYRSRRSESLLESLKQAESQNNPKPRRTSNKGLNASWSRIGTKIGEDSSALSKSFTAGVTNKENEQQKDKTDATNGDLLSSIMKETTQTFEEMKLKNPALIPVRRYSLPTLERKDDTHQQTVASSTMKRGHSSPPQEHKKKVHFAHAVSFAPTHLPNSQVKPILKRSRPTQQPNAHSRPIISYDTVTMETSSPEGHRGFSRQVSNSVRTLSVLPSSADKQSVLPESSDRTVPKLHSKKSLTKDQFIGWILGWKVGHMEGKIDDLAKVLNGCYFNTLKEVPNSFSSVDEFYERFIPLKMVEIWGKLQNIYAVIGNNRSSVAVLTESFQAKFEEQPYKICTFKVALTETAGKSKPSSTVYPQRCDLVIIGPESSYSFVPVFGYVDEAQSFKSAGFYSSNNSQELQLRVRVFGDVDFKAHRVKLQVMTSMSTYINQFQAFISLEKSALCSNILSPTRRDVFGEGQSSAVVDKLLKDILTRQQDNRKPSHPKPNSLTKEQEKFIKTTFHCIQQSYAIPRICMLQGPPCSGKSSALIHLVSCLLLHSSKESGIPQSSIPQAARPKILLCAPSDTAVDVLTGKLWKMVRHLKEDGIPHNTPESLPYFILRLGDARLVDRRYRRFVLDEIVSRIKAQEERKLKELRTRIGGLQMREQSLEASIQHKKYLIKKSGQIEQLQHEKMKLREERKKVEAVLHKEQKETYNPEQIKQDVMNKADVIICKLSDISSPELQKLLRLPPTSRCVLRFSCAIIDEACQGLEIDTILPLYSGITKLVLAGDPHEMKPESFRLIPEKFKLTQSLFTRLWMKFQESAFLPVLTLTEQHWCHPEIYSFPNKTFYNKKITTRRKQNMYIPLVPYLVFNLTDGQQQANETGDWSNEAELELIQCIVTIINQQKLPEIGLAIISPYPEQTRRIKEKINVPHGWYVGDVDGLQGRMKDIVIISCVRSEVMSSKDSSFLHNHSKLNVALTRGCYSVFIIGNFNVLPKINTLWSNLIKDASHRDLCMNIVRKEFIKRLAQTCLVSGYKNYQEKIIQRKQNANSQG